ncbi:hypothetical protein FOG50_02671 [Hanseniaspora uvarum]|nr:hypothetical protein FOG50_02671 [Hanseniaspora uvarum]
MNLQLFLSLVILCSTSSNAWSPTDSYAPGNVVCPSDLKMLREAVGLSDQETDWLKKRDAITQPILKQWLETRFAKTEAEQTLINEVFNAGSTSNERLPRIAIAASGGGYRAMLCGAGQIAGLDSRTTNSDEAGLGGLLDSSTYLSGLSGGNWLVGSLAFNNWTSVQDIIDSTADSSNDDPIWDITHSIIDPEGINSIHDFDVWESISNDVHQKKLAGFDVSLTDIWGLALTRDFFPTLTDDKGHGNWGAMSFSDLAKYEAFVNAEMPFTIHVADSRYPGIKVVNTNNTLFEFNAYEMGSWDGTVNAFANITYVGTDVTNGNLNSDTCVKGLDSVPFVLGTSSSLFNEFLLDINSTDLPSFLKKILSDFLTDLSDDYYDISVWDNNPFYESNYAFENVTSQINYNSEITSSKTLGRCYLCFGQLL